MSDILLIACPHCHRRNRLPRPRLADAARCGQCQHALLAAEPIALDSVGFATHADTDLPLLVDFWAPWCGPCRQFAPVFAQAARPLQYRARLAKVNTESEPTLAQQYAIRSIPTLAVFRRGREVARLTGAQSLPALLAWAEPYVLPPR